MGFVLYYDVFFYIYVILTGLCISHFVADPDEVLKHQKLRCTSCCTYLQSMILEGRDIYHHPVLKVLMCKVFNLLYTVFINKSSYI